jgi:hypothetical protein
MPGGVNVAQPENAETPASVRIIFPWNPASGSVWDQAVSRLRAQIDAGMPAAKPGEATYVLDDLTAASAPAAAARGEPGQLAMVEVSTGQPAVTDTTAIETAKVVAESRRPLLWWGIGCIIGGLLVATLLKYPTPGGLLALCGGALLGIHAYPWLGLVAAALSAAAVGIYIGYEVAERRAKTSSSTTP